MDPPLSSAKLTSVVLFINNTQINNCGDALLGLAKSVCYILVRDNFLCRCFQQKKIISFL